MTVERIDSYRKEDITPRHFTWSYDHTPDSSSDEAYDDRFKVDISDIETSHHPVSSEEPYDIIEDRREKRLGEVLKAAHAVYADTACGNGGQRQIIIS